MKKSLLFLLLFFTVTIFAQPAIRPKATAINILGLQVDFAARDTKAELTYANGEKQVGYIRGFIQNKAVTLGIQNPFKNFDYIDALNLSDKSFSFRKSLDDKAVVLQSEEVSEVKILDEDITVRHYKLMDMATVNSDGTIKNLNRKAWLPFYSQGVVNILSFDVYEEKLNHQDQGTGTYEKTVTMIFLNDPKNNLAINVRDYGIMDMFKAKKLLNKWTGGLVEIFKDCPEFIKSNTDAKGIWNFEADYFETEELEKAKIKEIKADKSIKREERNIQLNTLDTDIQILPYARMIEDYSKKCN